MKALTKSSNVQLSQITYYLLLIAVGLILFGLKLMVIRYFGNPTPFWDQWDAEAAGLYKPFLDKTLSLGDLFKAHNEHRISTTRIISLLMLEVNGIWNPILQMIINAIMHVTSILLLVVTAVKAIRRKNLIALLIFSLVFFSIPYGWENTLAGFQSSFYLVILFSILSLWLTITSSVFSRKWWTGLSCGFLAFFSLASGVFTMISIAAIYLIICISRGISRGESNKKYLLIGVFCLSLSLIGVLLTPNVDHHSELKASSVSQFIISFTEIFSWPLPPHMFSSIFRNLPSFLFLVTILLKRPMATDKKWFITGLVFWSAGIGLSIAYGRAVGSMSPRYLDLYIFSIFANFICLLSLINEPSNKHKSLIFLLIIWILAITSSLFGYSINTVPAQVSEKKNSSIVQERNLKGYIYSGDKKTLYQKSKLDIPYPSPDRLSLLVDDATIQNILPSNLRRRIPCNFSNNDNSQGYIKDGFYPTVPKISDKTLGSYNLSGNFFTGQATIKCESYSSLTPIIIPVTGYPKDFSMNISIIQNGAKMPVIIYKNPNETWTNAYSFVNNGSFTISLTDGSTEKWFAIGEPVVIGNLDIFATLILKYYYLAIATGVVICIVISLSYKLRSYM